MKDGMVQVEGQKVISGGKGAKSNDSFESARSMKSSEGGAASLPKIEGDYCNTPIGQKVK